MLTLALLSLMLTCIQVHSAEEQLCPSDEKMHTANRIIRYQIPSQVKKNSAVLISTLQHACSFPTALAQLVLEMMGNSGYGTWFPHATVYQPCDHAPLCRYRQEAYQPSTFSCGCASKPLHIIPLHHGHFVATRLLHMPEKIILWNSNGELCKSYDERGGAFVAFTALPEINLIASSETAPKPVDTLAADAWDYTTGQSVHSFHDNNHPYLEYTRIRLLIALPPHQLALCSPWHQQRIEVWDMNKKKRIVQSKLINVSFEYGFVQLSTGDFAANYYHEKSKCFKVAIWKRAADKWIHTSSGHTHNISNMVALPGGLLATTSADRNAPQRHILEDFIIKVWNTENGIYVYNLLGHKNIISSLIMLPPNNLASGSHDGIIKIWDLEKRICARVFNNKHPIFTILSLPHGQVAAGSSDTINIWDLKAGVVLQQLPHNNVHTLKMLSDGKLLSANPMGVITIWNSTLSTTARSHECRCLTRLWKLRCAPQRILSNCCIL